MSKVASSLKSWILKVGCPKCGVPSGVHCRFSTGQFSGINHLERRLAAESAGFHGTVELWGATTPKTPKPNNWIPGTGDHLGEVWVSGNCKAGRHNHCYSNGCICSCHPPSTLAPVSRR